MEEQVLIHHGIKGQKWGIRRFQNADGSLTAAGRRRYGNGASGSKGEAASSRKGLTDAQKDVLKNVGKAALIAGTVAAAGYLYTQNSEAINASISKMSSKPMKSIAEKAVKGHNYVQELAKEAKAGAKEGIKQAPKNIREGVTEGIGAGVKGVAKVAAEGAAIIAAKKMLEAASSKSQVDSYTQAYNAYNKKRKVGQVGSNKKEDDDDE